MEGFYPSPELLPTGPDTAEGRRRRFEPRTCRPTPGGDGRGVLRRCQVPAARSGGDLLPRVLRRSSPAPSSSTAALRHLYAPNLKARRGPYTSCSCLLPRLTAATSTPRYRSLSTLVSQRFSR